MGTHQNHLNEAVLRSIHNLYLSKNKKNVRIFHLNIIIFTSIIKRRILQRQGFPMEFYFRGHKSPLTLIQGDISGDFRGQSYDT